MTYESEGISKALIAQLQAELSGALDTVEAAWAGTDPVTLPDPVTWFEGHKPTVLELESVDFPFVAVILAEREPQDRPCRWGYQEQSVTAFVDYFVVADDETTVNKRAHRYAQAICLVLQAERVLEGYQQMDYEPQVKLSEASRHAATTESDLFDDSEVDFIQAGRVIVLLE